MPPRRHASSRSTRPSPHVDGGRRATAGQGRAGRPLAAAAEASTRMHRPRSSVWPAQACASLRSRHDAEDCQPRTMSAEDAERELELLGLIGLQDPPRRHAAAAIAACRTAGIRVSMMTGDHPAQRAAIARTGRAARSGRDGARGRGSSRRTRRCLVRCSIATASSSVASRRRRSCASPGRCGRADTSWR